jgi:S-adenosylmethionine:tRNA ribosyltransferase-isomerase
MRVSDFDYDLPQELIAQKPLPDRDRSRMMVLDRKTRNIFHSHFRDFVEQLDPGDVIVLNTSRVMPARLWGTINGKDIEFLLLKEVREGEWETLCRPAKKAKIDEQVVFSPSLTGLIIGIKEEGRRIIRFSKKDVLTELDEIGFAPLPPYIKREKCDHSLRSSDLERYQTVYARRGVSIAAPTAGLHFTPRVLAKIKKKGIEVVEISLEVGLATFQPIRAVLVEEHAMLEETFTISPSACDLINTAKTEKRQVVAIGTTSVRALESAWENRRIRAGSRATKLFIFPGFRFRVVDRLLTNFHLPKSTLLMLVAAFAGFDLTKAAYSEAILHKYRFYSYGDCMFIK